MTVICDNGETFVDGACVESDENPFAAAPSDTTSTNTGTVTDTVTETDQDTSTDTGSLCSGRISGEVSVSGMLGCGEGPNSCDGDLYVGAYELNPITSPSSVVQWSGTPTVMPAPGTTLPFTVPDVPCGTWFLYAFIDIDGNATGGTPSAGEGDIYSSNKNLVDVQQATETEGDLFLTARVPETD
jgi:hypothetical protein